MNKSTKKKIIVLCLKLTTYRWKSHELDKIFQKYDIEVHELLNFILPNTTIKFGEPFKYKKTKIFKSLKEWQLYCINLRKSLKSKNKKLIILDTINDLNNFGLNLDNFKMYLFLKHNKFFLIKYHFPGLPDYTSQNKFSIFFIKKCLTNIKTLFVRPKYFFGKVIIFFYSLLGSFLRLYPDLVFVAGNNEFNKVKKLKIKRLKIVPFSTQDYSKTLQINLNDHLKPYDRYAVFLSDRDYNLTPEDALFDKNAKSTLTLDNWHKPLLKFFSNLERELKINIIIAAHPKSEKKNTINIFNPRKVFFDQTHRLIKNCKFVITLRSSSLNYAVAYNKPIMFINSDSLTPSVQQFINYLAGHFNQSPLNINGEYYLKIINFKKILSSKVNNLKKFKVNYVSNLSSNLPNYKVIIKNIDMI